MPLVVVLLVLCCVGVVLWLINTFVPMDAKIKTILNVVAVLIVVVWLLQALGVLPFLNAVRIR